ncbi:hypothetical protein VPH35_021331 [Triticum aestivum]
MFPFSFLLQRGQAVLRSVSAAGGRGHRRAKSGRPRRRPEDTALRATLSSPHFLMSSPLCLHHQRLLFFDLDDDYGGGFDGAPWPSPSPAARLPRGERAAVEQFGYGAPLLLFRRALGLTPVVLLPDGSACRCPSGSRGTARP